MSGHDFMAMQLPPPEGAICDFCSSPDVRWMFPCRDHRRHTEDATALLQQGDGSLRIQKMALDSFSSGAWAACPVCHALIQRGDRTRLARRSAKRLIKKMGFGSAWSLSDATAHVRRLHDQFWENREGPPIRHDTRPKEAPTR